MTTTSPPTLEDSTGRRARTLRVLVASVGILLATAVVLIALVVDLPAQLGLGVGAPGGDGGTAPVTDERPDGAPSDAERLEAERAEAEREADEHAEAERLAAEQQAEEARQAEEERRAAEEAEQARIAASRDAQQRLVDLGYLVGAVDGEQGQQTTAALMAFQAVNGLQVDGILGPQTEAALAEPVEPTLGEGPGTRIEVDLDRQVLHLVEDGTRVVTMKVSSGNGAEYARGDGSRGIARTPVGDYRIQRRIAGVRESSAGLGTLYDPMYFHGGYAIHGSNSVPAGPASHGCVRLSRADAVWLFDRVPDGTTVQLRGGTHVFTPA